MLNQLDAFVLMPYGSNGEYKDGSKEATFVYDEIISPAVHEAARRIQVQNEAAGFPGSIECRIVREMDRQHAGSITSALLRSLAAADVVIADITGRNANVFLELGIRYSLRSKVTILIAQVNTQIPFDINVYRYIEYERFNPRVARDRIAEMIREGMSDKVRSDSIVFDVFPSMSVTIPDIVSSFGVEVQPNDGVMQWKEYMKHIEDNCAYLEIAARDYRYHPAAIIGISNGGAAAADWINKRVFRDTPVLTLWAKRREEARESAFWYFGNPFNDATMAGISQAGRRGEDGTLELLLIDDHMGTGQTAKQAVAYLRHRLGEKVRVTFIPIVAARKEAIAEVEDLLPYSRVNDAGKPIFHIRKEQFLEQLVTKAHYFPYLEKQVYH